MTEHDEIVDDLEYQLQLAGQAGLDLLEANAELTDRVSELEEIELHSTSLSATLRDDQITLVLLEGEDVTSFSFPRWIARAGVVVVTVSIE